MSLTGARVLLGLFVALLLLLAGLLLEGRRRRAHGLADRVVHRDGDTDRTTALAAQRLADDGCETSLQYALGEFVRYGQQCGVGDQSQGLAAFDPALVLRVYTVPPPLTQQLLQNSWPHCGKIGRYVSHKARSLTGSHEGVVLGTEIGMGREKGMNRSLAKVVRATAAVQVVVHRLCTVSLPDGRFDRMA
ncbi:hypothetical protein GCM10010449_02950 [Streptomyces rectiviolaceus]|uniref:Secreted protein n=1 Tax=Streptomyces rectiviolaceus TaxID=332591 RepID=A0ABP6M8L4_9ACTN